MFQKSHLKDFKELRNAFQGDNQVGGENNFRFLLFPAWKWSPFNVTTLQYMIVVEETEIFVLTNIFDLWVEKLQLTSSKQSSLEMTFVSKSKGISDCL